MAVTTLTSAALAGDSHLHVDDASGFPEAPALVWFYDGAYRYAAKTDTLLTLTNPLTWSYSNGEIIRSDGTQATCFTEMVCPYCWSPTVCESPFYRGFCLQCAEWEVLTDSMTYYLLPPVG